MAKSDNLARELDRNINSIGDQVVDAKNKYMVWSEKIHNVLLEMTRIVKDGTIKDKHTKYGKLVGKEKELREVLDKIPYEYKITTEHGKLRSDLLNNNVDTTLSLYSAIEDYDRGGSYKKVLRVYVQDTNTGGFNLATDEQLNEFFEKLKFKVSIVNEFNKWFKEDIKNSIQSCITTSNKVTEHDNKIKVVLLDLYNKLPMENPLENNELLVIERSIQYAINCIVDIENVKKQKQVGVNYIETVQMLQKHLKRLKKYSIINPSQIDELKLTYGATETCCYITTKDSVVLRLLPDNVQVPKIGTLIMKRELKLTEVKLLRGECLEVFNVSDKHKRDYMGVIQSLRVELRELLEG